MKKIAPSLRLAFCLLATLFLFGSVGLATYWLTWPYQIVVFHDDHGEILYDGGEKRPFLAGSRLFYQTALTHFTTGIPVTVSRAIVDGIVTTLAESTYETTEGAFRRVNASTTLPLCTPPGVYVLRIITSFQINPLRTISKTFTTSPFTVEANCPQGLGRYKDSP
jgi:hypothetical protein